MPAKNSRKDYSPNTYYHIYNRGVEKRDVFQDEQDYGVFLSYLKDYLLPKDTVSLQMSLATAASWSEKEEAIKLLRINNFYGSLSLNAFCLMPNHFHLLIYQTDEEAMDSFLNSFGTRYVMYFNKKYKRVGPLFQGVYKANIIATQEQLLYLTLYIHHNPAALYPDLPKGEAFMKQPTSLPEYLGERKSGWVHPEPILSYFSNHNPALSYRNFVYEIDEGVLEPIKNLVIED